MILGKTRCKGYGYRDLTCNDAFTGAAGAVVKVDTAIATAGGANSLGGHNYSGVSAS